MPDQVRLHDPQPQNQESHLGLYGSPGSPGSDSPLSLVVRKEDQRKLQTYPVESPGRSSGFSDGSGSYESSPNRSPNHNQDSRDSDKPLSLVIRKNLVSHFQGDATHNKYSLHPKPNAVPPKKKWRGEEVGEDVSRNYQDSGNEEEDEEEERALVISEQSAEEEQAEEETKDRVSEDTVYDFSTTKKTNQEAFGDTNKEREKQPTGIKIKDFARLDMPAAAPVEPKDIPPVLEARDEDEDDVESEPESDCASVDTWSSSLAEDKLFSGTDPVIRRIRSTSSGDSVYQCDFCEKLFTNKYHLQSHLVVHTGERAFVCKTCKKTFGRKSTLRAHMTTHTKVSNFMCTVCEKACNDNNSLEEHMRMHTGEKPFVCTICQKAYARKSHLNVHYRVHTGERPFVCIYCNKDFTEKRFLNDHLQTAHNGVDGPLKCPNCGREFAYKTSLKQHLKKQMCERNMKRSHGNLSASAIAKQFQCPFCDKSYSWKQTLKQHVSMYHRNKVHTDEFWRYELTKNRKTVLDDVANEDAWKQQLGKHAEEAAKLKKEAAEAAAAAATEENLSRPATPAAAPGEQTGGWMDQVKRSSTPAPAPAAPTLEPVTTEMKLLALQNLQQNLQSSLHFMSMGMAAPQLAAMTSLQRLAGLQSTLTAADQQPVKIEPSGPPQDSYLSLLAQFAKKESEERSLAENANGESSSMGARPPAILPAKEESSVKRTQLWLQQVNKYRHKPPKEELDANHEQLWEQQISRVKRNPVRSPLEPVEIVIEDDGEKSGSSFEGSPRHTIRSSVSRRSTLTNNNIQEGSVVYQANLAPAGASYTSPLVFPPAACPTPPIRIPTPQAAATPPPPSFSPSPNASPAPPPEEGGLLKSLLMDNRKRKRSSSKELGSDPNPKKSPSPRLSLPRPAATPEPPSSDTDILRKVLMGIKDPQPSAAAAKETPRRPLDTAGRSQQDPPATRMFIEAPVTRQPKEAPTVQQPMAVNNNNNNNNNPLVSSGKPGTSRSSQEEAGDKKTSIPKEKESTYAKTSVLKHLLHRFTGANQ